MLTGLTEAQVTPLARSEQRVIGGNANCNHNQQGVLSTFRLANLKGSLIRYKYKATIQYLGSRYAGWQVQKNQSTVQQLLQDALSHLAGSRINVIGASRTDSGVHALGQVAHFLFPEKETIADLQKAVNANLPSDVRVTRLLLAPRGFHAQKDATRKRYEYRIENSQVLSPFLSGRVCHIPAPLDYFGMQEAASHFLGEHDFTAFAASRTTVKNKVRRVLLSQTVHQGTRITFRVEARGFLHHMVRNMAGTLINIGLGKRKPSSIDQIIESRDRNQAGPTASAEGLYLVRIWY